MFETLGGGFCHCSKCGLRVPAPDCTRVYHRCGARERPPTLVDRVRTFVSAQRRWRAAGGEYLADDAIEARIAVCRGCPELVNDHCRQCGCRCSRERKFWNKLAIPTEACPLGKWAA